MVNLQFSICALLWKKEIYQSRACIRTIVVKKEQVNQRRKRRQQMLSESANEPDEQQLLSPLSFLSAENSSGGQAGNSTMSPKSLKSSTARGPASKHSGKPSPKHFINVGKVKPPNQQQQQPHMRANENAAGRGGGNHRGRKAGGASGSHNPQRAALNHRRANHPNANKQQRQHQHHQNASSSYYREDGLADTENENSLLLQQSQLTSNEPQHHQTTKPLRYELGGPKHHNITADLSAGQRNHSRNMGQSQMTQNQESLSYDQQSYDDELDYQREDYAMTYQPYDLVNNGNKRFIDDQMFNQGIQEKMQKDRANIVGSPYYEKRCKHHHIEDDPDDLNCTFMPQLYVPLGAHATMQKHGQEMTGVVDPLMFQPIKTIKHSPMTKSSIDYHYKRLAHARKGPQVYRSKVQPAGGGPFYQKVAVEGTSSYPVPDGHVEQRKHQLKENQRQAYYAGMRDNDPRFNLVGGTFKGAQVLRAAPFPLNLPDKDADRKRLRQKDLLGRGFDSKFGDADEGYRARNARAGGQTHEASACSMDSYSAPTAVEMRRSIQTHARMVPLQGGPGPSSLRQQHYSKATIADRFANKGIRNRTETRTMPMTTMASSGPRDAHVLKASESRESRSLMTATLNQKSQISDAFLVGAKAATSNNDEHQQLKHQNGGSPDQSQLIRGVPKFVQQPGGLGMTYAQRQYDAFTADSSAYDMHESAQLQNIYHQGRFGSDMDILMHQHQQHQQQPEHAQYGSLPQYQDETTDGKQMAHRYQEKWYPQGIDPVRQTFLKRSLRNQSFNPNRTFTSATMWNPQEQLITKLFVQSNDSTLRKHRRKETSDLHNVFKENQFNVVETSAGDAAQDGFVNVGDLLGNSRREKAGENLAGSLPAMPRHKKSPPAPMSPGLAPSGQYFTVVSNSKKKPLQEKKAQKKHNGSQNSGGSQEFMNALDKDGGGITSGGDALVLDHGYFNFINIPEFSTTKHAAVYAAYKKKTTQANQSDTSPKAETSAGGELASEQMAELAQEMLESDQKVGEFKNEREDPVFSMNNLKDVPFGDFLILHKIFPKIFMLELDTKHMLKQTQTQSRKNLHEKEGNSLERKQTMRQKMANQESIKIQKALTRRQLTQQMHSFIAQNPHQASLVAGKSEAERMLHVGKMTTELMQQNQQQSQLQGGNKSPELRPDHQSTLYQSSPGASTAAAAAIKVVYNEEVADARADGKPADPHNASDLMEEKSSFVSDELTEREKKYDLNSAENMSPHPLISLAQMADPTQSQGSGGIVGAKNNAAQRYHQNPQQQQYEQDQSYFGLKADKDGSKRGASPTVQQVPIRIVDSNAPGTSLLLRQQTSRGVSPGNQSSDQQSYAARSTLRTMQTKKSAKMPDPVKLTSYETCLQKYTNYLRIKKYDRCEMLMKQGSTIFTKDECQHQFQFNQGVLYLAQMDYTKAVEKYLALYTHVCKDFAVRPSAQRIEGPNTREDQKFAILQNLIVAYMMREEQNPSRASQQALYQLLRSEKLLNVRYTQSPDELNLFKMATYVKQYIRKEQARRYMDNQEEEHESPSEMLQRGPTQPDFDTSGNENQPGQSDTPDAYQNVRNELLNTRIIVTGGSSDGAQKIKIEQEDGVEAEEGPEYDDHNKEFEEYQTKEIAFQRTFKKVGGPRAAKKGQVHPLYTLQKKFEFLNRHTPIMTVPSISQSQERAAAEQTAQQEEVAIVPDQEFTKLKAQKKVQEQKKETQLKEKVQKVLESLNKKKLGREAGERQSVSSAVGQQRQKVIRVGVKLSSRGTSRDEAESPYNRIPMSEADSIFDEVHQMGATNTHEFVLKRNSNQASDQDAGEGDEPKKLRGEEGEETEQAEESAKELGVDLSALYSHKKPKYQLNIEERLIRAAQKKQDANFLREQKYRNMAINQIAQRKKHNEYQTAFNSDMQQIDETIMQMQKVEVEMIRDGGGIKKLDPLQEQYKALASSISLLCQEPNIADIILDYLAQQNDMLESRKSGAKPKGKQAEAGAYSAALEVIIHATRHILDQENVNINEQDRVFLINRINQVKDMFEQELNNPELIANKRRTENGAEKEFELPDFTTNDQ